MNKKQKISKYLDELHVTHPSWWADIAEKAGINLEELELDGYIAKDSTTNNGTVTYNVTAAGLEFIEKNPVYRRPSLHEILHDRQGVVRYRGKRIPIYVDDPGQQYYFYYKGECVGCGAFNPDYEDYVKMYIDDKLDKICWIDASDFPGMRARLEYRTGKNGKRAKYLILTDRDHGMYDQPIYVYPKKTKNEECIDTAKYIMSIIRLQHEREDEEQKKTTEDNK